MLMRSRLTRGISSGNLIASKGKGGPSRHSLVEEVEGHIEEHDRRIPVDEALSVGQSRSFSRCLAAEGEADLFDFLANAIGILVRVGKELGAVLWALAARCGARCTDEGGEGDGGGGSAGEPHGGLVRAEALGCRWEEMGVRTLRSKAYVNVMVSLEQCFSVGSVAACEYRQFMQCTLDLWDSC